MGLTDRKDLQVLASTLEGYTDRIFDRLDLENKSVPVRNTPVGGSEGIRALEGFWELAREGFRMTFRMDREGSYNIKPRLLLAATTTDTDSIWDEIRNLGIGVPLEDTRLNPAMVFFRHVLVSVRDLSRQGDVSLASLEPSLGSRRLGNLAQNTIDWRRNIDPETVWGVIGELKGGSNMAIYQSGNFDRDSIRPVVRAAQFFAKGVNLARGMATD